MQNYFGNANMRQKKPEIRKQGLSELGFSASTRYLYLTHALMAGGMFGFQSRSVSPSRLGLRTRSLPSLVRWQMQEEEERGEGREGIQKVLFSIRRHVGCLISSPCKVLCMLYICTFSEIFFLMLIIIISNNN